MNAGALLNSKGVQLAMGAIVAGVVLYVITAKLGKAALKAIDTVNEGTPYQGAGVVGTLGHGADVVSGGFLSELGGWLGSKAYDIFGDDPDLEAPTPNPNYAPRKSQVRADQ